MKVTAWLTRKVGPLPLWAWPAVAVGGFVAYRYLKSRQTAAATSGTAVPIGGSGFSFPDYAQPDSGVSLPTSSIPLTATDTTNTGSTGGGSAASGTSANTSPISGPGAPPPGGQTRINLTNPPPNFYSPQVAAPAPAPSETRINLTAPHPNYYTVAPSSAMATTAGTAPVRRYY